MTETHQAHPAKSPVQSAFQSLVAEMRAEQRLPLIEGRLEGLGERYFKRGRSAEFMAFLIERVRLGRPFATIRLGDGEGNILLAAEPGPNQALADYVFPRIWWNMFGTRPLDPADKQQFLDDFVASVAEVDVVAPHTAVQVAKTLAHEGFPENKIRGASGVLGPWYWLGRHMDLFDDPNRYFSYCHYHAGLGEHIGALLAASKYVSAVTCYPDFLDVLARRHQFVQGVVLGIPPQCVNIGKNPETVHFPDRYRKILAELDREDFTGHTFLVGAGLLGKIYCARIRRAGGIAIDIGSLIDVLMGKSVRLWHQSATFLAEVTARFTEWDEVADEYRRQNRWDEVLRLRGQGFELFDTRAATLEKRPDWLDNLYAKRLRDGIQECAALVAAAGQDDAQVARYAGQGLDWLDRLREKRPALAGRFGHGYTRFLRSGAYACGRLAAGYGGRDEVQAAGYWERGARWLERLYERDAQQPAGIGRLRAKLIGEAGLAWVRHAEGLEGRDDALAVESWERGLAWLDKLFDYAPQQPVGVARARLKHLSLAALACDRLASALKGRDDAAAARYWRQGAAWLAKLYELHPAQPLSIERNRAKQLREGALALERSARAAHPVAENPGA